MLYTDTDSFVLYFVVEDLTEEINARPQFRDAFYVSESVRIIFPSSVEDQPIHTQEKWDTSKTRTRAIR